jgi:hypothetical protein
MSFLSGGLSFLSGGLSMRIAIPAPQTIHQRSPSSRQATSGYLGQSCKSYHLPVIDQRPQ